MKNSNTYDELMRRAILARKAAEQIYNEGNSRLSRLFAEHAELWATMAGRLQLADNRVQPIRERSY